MKLHLAVCFFCVSAIFSSTFADIGRARRCCLRVSRFKVDLNMIHDYKWQSEGLCPVTAVVLYTRDGKGLCADPNMKWIKSFIRKVDEEKNKKTAEENEEGPPPPTATNQPENSSRWLQQSAVSAETNQKHKAEGSVRSTKAPSGSKRQRKGGKRKRKGKSKERKRKVKKDKSLKSP